jgi:hypothetical protein
VPPPRKRSRSSSKPAAATHVLSCRSSARQSGTPPTSPFDTEDAHTAVEEPPGLLGV